MLLCVRDQYVAVLYFESGTGVPQVLACLGLLCILLTGNMNDMDSPVECSSANLIFKLLCGGSAIFPSHSAHHSFAKKWKPRSHFCYFLSLTLFTNTSLKKLLVKSSCPLSRCYSFNNLSQWHTQEGLGCSGPSLYSHKMTLICIHKKMKLKNAMLN